MEADAGLRRVQLLGLLDVVGLADLDELLAI
jgi:hypothetical protein